MSESTKKFSGATLYKTPFSRAYWAQAASEFKDLKMLLFAALMIALRVALKPVGIPIAADLRINAGFFVNAFGAAAFGPVVAIPAAAISDLLGCILFPQGVYYPPFMLTEIAGSVIFALFFYRAEITPLRVILARFCVNFFVNILLQTPLMRGYYAFIGSSALYPLFDTVRIAKNIVLFPVEAVLLMLFLRAVVPPVQKLGYIHSGVGGLSLTKSHIILLAVLFLFSVGATTAYAIYDYNHKSFSASYTAQERLTRNTEMNAWVASQTDIYSEEELVTIIESARSKVGAKEMTYELAIYRVKLDLLEEKTEAGEGDQLTVLRGYSKSKAAKDSLLERVGTAVAVTDKKTGEHISLDIRWEENTNHE